MRLETYPNKQNDTKLSLDYRLTLVLSSNERYSSKQIK